MNSIRNISSFIKIEHALFSLPLLFAGALLTPGLSLQALPWPQLGFILAAGIGARTCALALNRILDRKIDALNPRTQARELPSKALTLSKAWAVAFSGLVLYLYATYKLGPACLKLSPIPIAVFVIYPLMKRFTHFAHFGVGSALALAPLGGYYGITNAWPTETAIWYLAAFAFCWVAGFDILYATLDEEFDKSQGLQSIPARFGAKPAMEISLVLHALAFFCLAALGPQFPNPSPLKWLALAPAGILLALEQKYGYSLEMNSPFFKINAWIGVAALAWVFTGIAL